MSMLSANKARHDAGLVEPAPARSNSDLQPTPAAAPQLRPRARLLAWLAAPHKTALQPQSANGPWRQHTWSGPCE